MSATTALAVVMIAWLAIGVATGSFMGWRGHDWFTWGLLGAVLGPLVIPLVVASGGRAGVGTRQPRDRGTPQGAPDDPRPAYGEEAAWRPR